MNSLIRGGILLILVLSVGACASRKVAAPVVNYQGKNTQSVANNTPVPAGYIRVKSGDTLYRIALDHGQSYQNIARWNNLSDPMQISVGQLLRIVPPIGGRGAMPNATTQPVPMAKVTGSSIDSTGNSALGSTVSSAANQSMQGNSSIRLIWPVRGTVILNFSEDNNKGINIAGNAGDAVVAAQLGTVVYAGNSLRGYGNLIIIKHNETFLTAYAHNQVLLVKEGEQVRQGQKIAEVGSTDAPQPMLHFEVRHQGKPVDPLRYLP